MKWKLKVYGVRGSYPETSGKYSRYGGNTTCFYLDCGMHFIFDAGSGIRQLGRELADRKQVHLFLSHLHLDHILGLPGFSPLFQEDREIHIYGEDHQGKSIENLLYEVICPPYWPFSLSDPCVKAKICYHTISANKTFHIQEIEITPVRLSHPNECLGFIVKKEKQRFAWLLDCELSKQTDIPDTISSELNACSLAVMDSSFLPGQVIPGFGHSSWEECLSYAEKMGIKTVLLSHFGDAMTDQVLDYESRGNRENVIFAQEGMELEIDEKGEIQVYEKEK